MEAQSASRRIREAHLKGNRQLLVRLDDGRSMALPIEDLPSSTGPSAVEASVLADGDLLSIQADTGDFFVTAHELDSLAGDEPMSRGDLAASIGQTLKFLRSERSLTLGDLQVLTGIARPNLSKLESGLVAPRLETLAVLGRALGVSVADIITAAESNDRLAARVGVGFEAVEASARMARR
jgi:Helix-turn-helix.